MGAAADPGAVDPGRDTARDRGREPDDDAQRVRPAAVVAGHPVTTLDVRFPAGPLSGAVAAALRDDPADSRTLGEWGREVGASERTLARAFVAETGMPFGRWRTLLRLQ